MMKYLPSHILHLVLLNLFMSWIKWSETYSLWSVCPSVCLLLGTVNIASSHWHTIGSTFVIGVCVAAEQHFPISVKHVHLVTLTLTLWPWTCDLYLVCLCRPALSNVSQDCSLCDLYTDLVILTLLSWPCGLDLVHFYGSALSNVIQECSPCDLDIDLVILNLLYWPCCHDLMTLTFFRKWLKPGITFQLTDL